MLTLSLSNSNHTVYGHGPCPLNTEKDKNSSICFNFFPICLPAVQAPVSLCILASVYYMLKDEGKTDRWNCYCRADVIATKQEHETPSKYY